MEHRVDELDRNTKVYVDSKVKSIINPNPPMRLIPNISNTPFVTLKKEIGSLNI